MTEQLVELHLALGQPAQACAVAVSQALAEQASGNYKVGCGCWAQRAVPCHCL